MADTVLEFAEALNQNSLQSSSLPRFEALADEESQPNSAGAPPMIDAPDFHPQCSQARAPIAEAQPGGYAKADWSMQQQAMPLAQQQPASPQLNVHMQHSYDPGPLSQLE